MEQPGGQQPALLSDQLPDGGRRRRRHRWISESPEYAHWWYRGDPGVPWVCVGITQQGYTPQDEEAVSNHVCDSHHAV